MYTVDNMIRSLRSKLQEHNNKKIGDTEILDALNQAQDFAFDIVARRYPDSLGELRSHTVDSNGEFLLPEDAFEQRLTRLFVKDGELTTPLIRVDYRKVDDFTGNAGFPTHYAIVKNKVIVLPRGNSQGYSYRSALVADIEPLVKAQGRIREIDAGNRKVILDAVGSELTSSVDDENRFVNLIDGQSGLIKATMQVKHIDSDTKTITFKTSPDRAKVYNRIPTGTVPTDLEQDDYICLVTGSCVPYFKKPVYNYVLQFATTEIKRSLGMDSQAEEVALRKYEDQMESLNSKRESSLRVTRSRGRRSRRR